MVVEDATKTPIVTLTTDFGLNDYFVAVLKGVLLQELPSARLIDVTHNLSRHDIISAAFVIKEVVAYFPVGTIHLVVIDPGVGTSRKKMIVKHKGQTIVAPDNGVLTYLLNEAGSQAFEVLDSSNLKFKISPTFARRDHFAPIASALAKGIFPEDIGEKMSDAHQLNDLFCRQKESEVLGKIVYFDHFGNAITNLTRESLGEKLQNSHNLSVLYKKIRFVGLKKNYVEGLKDEGNLIINSSDHLEIFVPGKSAKKQFKFQLMEDILTI